MFNRLARVVGDEVLFRHIGHVVTLIVLRQKMVERLILGRTAVLRDGLIPLLGIGKLRIDIENNPAKRVLPVANDMSQRVFRTLSKHNSTP